MNTFVLRLLVNALALAAAAYVVDGIHLTGGFGSAVWVALVFGLVNALLKPIVMLLSLPFLLVTLGLFSLVVNAFMLLVTARLTDALSVSGLGAAIVGSLVISVVTMILGGSLKDDKRKKRRD